MNLNLNTSFSTSGFDFQVSSGVAANATRSLAGAKSMSNAADTFSISEHPASPEDIAAAQISDSVLSRNDPLGNLVKSAFSLPPPPQPW